MDKRKLKFKSLHKNLISSQVSSTSDIYETRSLIEPKNNSTLLAGKVFSTQSKFIYKYFKIKKIIKLNIYR